MDKQTIKPSELAKLLKEHIIRGDPGDGVPNILSPDNSFTDHIRQKTMTAKRVDYFLNTDPSQYVDTKWERNLKLIDLDFIPKDIQKSILDAFEKTKVNPRHMIMNYLIAHRLSGLQDCEEDF
jgi:hypothetical protein